MDFLYVALLDCAPAANFSAASASRRAEALSRTEEEEEDAKGRETSSAKARGARDLIMVAASSRDCCYLPPPGGVAIYSVTCAQVSFWFEGHFGKWGKKSRLHVIHAADCARKLWGGNVGVGVGIEKPRVICQRVALSSALEDDRDPPLCSSGTMRRGNDGGRI